MTITTIYHYLPLFNTTVLCRAIRCMPTRLSRVARLGRVETCSLHHHIVCCRKAEGPLCMAQQVTPLKVTNSKTKAFSLLRVTVRSVSHLVKSQCALQTPHHSGSAPLRLQALCVRLKHCMHDVHSWHCRVCSKFRGFHLALA